MVWDKRINNIDLVAVARSFSRAASTYDSATNLQYTIGKLLLQDLSLQMLQPAIIIDLGSGTGRFSQHLKNYYQTAQVMAVDIASGMLMFAKRAYRHQPVSYICADAMRLPFADHSVELIFTNFMLQWCNDLPSALKELRRVLKPSGILAFSTFGEGTLYELHRSWAQVDIYPHVNQFYKLSAINELLNVSGWYQLTLRHQVYMQFYSDIFSLMTALKVIGASNLHQNRLRGLMGKQRLRQIINIYESYRNTDGLLPASFKVIYGVVQKCG